jgi:hypothetical protein
LPPGTPPSPRETPLQGDWTPFDSKAQFKIADLLYRRAEMSASNIDGLFDLWTESLEEHNDPRGAPFKNHDALYATIDSSTLGNIPWQCFVIEIPDDINEDSPIWMRTQYEIWYRDPEAVASSMLSNPDFNGQFDLCPYIDLDAHGKCRWNNVMSGNMAWRRSVSILVPFVPSICPHGAARRMISLHPTQLPKVRCTAPLFLGAIRPQFLWRLGM